MHIPDGMLDIKTFTTLWAGGAGGIGYASWWIRKHLDGSKIVLMAVLAALIFGLQMLNFPIAAGTSGHFSGGAFAGILLGAWPACIVMSAVLVVQALFFGDGGITTLGANIVNMGIVAPLLGALVFELFQRIKDAYSLKIIGGFVAAFFAVIASAAMVALELWTSNHAQFFAALGAMVFWHAIIGVGEGVITAGLVAYIARVRPQMLGSRILNSGNTNDARQRIDAKSVLDCGDTDDVLFGSDTRNAPHGGDTNSALPGSGAGDISQEAGMLTQQSELVYDELPDTSQQVAIRSKNSLKSICVVLGIIAVLAAGVSFLASTHPDGLEFVYFESGIGAGIEEDGFVLMAPLSDYLLPGVDNEILATVGAGIIGVILTGVILLCIGTLLKRRASK